MSAWCFLRGHAILGRSPAMTDAVNRARHLVGKQVPVLIEGETGVGKELFARAIHAGHDPRRPFVVFNCGAVARDLLGAELFGHVRDAFTGATNEGRQGRFELAHGGTLCLDEIGELPLDLQPFLLRVVEEGVVYRLGDGQPRRVEVRLMALTNRTLADEVAAGRFRRDLYHRISVTRIRPPPLRERQGDLELLVAHLNATLAERHEVPQRQFGPEVLRLLAAYHWPGNVRELRNVVESLLLMSDAPDVRVDELAAGLSPDPIGPPSYLIGPPSHLIGPPSYLIGPPLGAAEAPASLEASERAAIVASVNLCRGNLTATAKSLGVSRSTLYRKIDRYRLHV